MIWLNEHETSVSRSNWKNSTVLVLEQLKTARWRSKTNGTLRSSAGDVTNSRRGSTFVLDIAGAVSLCIKMSIGRANVQSCCFA